MGFFDFLSAPKQDTPPIKKKQGAMPAGTVEEYPKGELPMNTTELWSWEPPEKQAATVPSSQESAAGASGGMEPYRSKEADLVKREHRAISEVRNLLNDSPASDPDVSKVRDALERGTLGSAQLAEDLGILLKNKNLVITGRASGVDVGLHRLISLRNELAAVAEEKGKLEAGGMPSPEKPQSIPYQELEMEAEQALKKSEVARLEAAQSGALSRDKKLKEAANWKAQAAALQQQAMDAKGLEEKRKLAGEPQVLPSQGDPNVVTSYMTGLGIDRETLVDRLHQSMLAVGIPDDQWEAPVNPQAGILRVMGAMDPNGQMAQLMVGQMAAAKAEDAAQAQAAPPKPSEDSELAGRIDETEKEIQGREAQMRNIYFQLGQTQFMHTWPGIILYVLIGMITQNPAFAARLLGGVGNREAIDEELKGLQADLRRYENRLSHQQTEQRLTRQEAARRLQRKDDSQEVWRRQVGMTLLNHRLIIERNAKKGNPETALMKKLNEEFKRSMTMASKLGKPPFVNPLTGEWVDKDAKKNFDHYMRKGASLDAQLEEIGGDVLEEEAAEE